MLSLQKDKEMMKQKRKGLRVVVFLLIVIAVIFLVKSYGIDDKLTQMELQKRVSAYGSLAPLIFIGLYIIATAAFLPASVLTILGGLLFGTWLGALYTIIGATIGAVVAFFIAKYFARPFVEDMAEKRFKKLREYDEKLAENGLATVLFLRFMPLFPFNGLNFVLGITKVKARDYIFGTLFGIIPGTLVYAYFGQSLGTFNIVQIIVSILLIVLLGLVYPVYKRIKGRNTSETEKGKERKKEVKRKGKRKGIKK